jgi:aminomethyltransferase
MKTTSLHEEHLALKAKMSDFAGYDMPIQYAGVKAEVQAVRENVGVFDVSHMGEFFVTGKDAISFVDYIITNDFAGAGMGKAVYSPLCRDNGTTIDDLIAYKLEAEKVLICVNAANIEKDWNWISSQTEGFEIELENKSEDYSLLAVQGPNTEATLKKIGFDKTDSQYYSAFESSWNGDAVIMARTGYTGEDGFEVFASHATIKKLWSELMNAGVAACGLAARDVLRLEVCYPLYGHELNDELTPLDAALKWTVKTKKEKFIGKDALENHTSKYRLVKLSLDKGIPREGYPVMNSNDEEIGKVTSGTMSVTSGKGVCLALVKRDCFPENKEFKIQVRKNIIEANYHTKAFVSGGHK